MKITCHRCGQEMDIQHKVGREEKCSNCSSYLHCCLNCRFYDSAAHWQCKETEIEWVEDKASGNFCDYFRPSDRIRPPNNRREEAKKKLNDLFK